MRGSVGRVAKELATSSIPDSGIYVQQVHVDANTVLPVSGHVVLVSPQRHAVPYLVRFEYGVHYPYHPLSLKFISRVPHPLIGDDGVIDLDILKSQWSPALVLSKVLISLQWVLSEPAHPDVLRNGCVANPDWDVGSITTEQRYIPELFSTLLEAGRPSGASGIPDSWHSWRFIRGLRSLLNMNPLAYKSSRPEWYGYLQSLAQVLSPLLGCSVPEEPTALEDAKQLWIVEARLLLCKHFHFDGLRMILCARLVEGGQALGDLRRINRVWTVIQSFISDVETSELFAQNHSLMRMVQANLTV